MLGAAWTRGQAASYFVLTDPKEVEMHLTLEVVGTCEGVCGRYLIARELWKTLPLEFREKAGSLMAQDRSRRLCPSCWSKLDRAGQLGSAKRLQLAKGVFVEEYLAMKSYGESDHTIQRTLGMSDAAFEKALERARKAGKIK